MIRYELVDHLGYVCAVVVNVKHSTVVNGIPQDFEPDVNVTNNYYAFGSLMPGRNFSSTDYRHGFNGMEKDDEIKGITGSSYDFGARMYDPRIGRWMSTDKLFAKRPWESPYSFVGNNPILNHEIDGNDYEVYVDHSTKTIIIKATFYTKKGDVTAAAEAKTYTEYWNKLSGDFQYKVGKGKEAKLYNINFELNPKAVDDPAKQLESTTTMKDGGIDKETGMGIMIAEQNRIDPKGNTFEVLPRAEFDRKKKEYGGSDGCEGFVYDGNLVTLPITSNSNKGLTGPHELGHTLGIDHFLGTIMGKDGGDIRNKNSVKTISAILGNAGITSNFIKDGVNSQARTTTTPKGSSPKGLKEGKLEGVKKPNFKL